jgi:hypothetical protein
MKKFYSLFVLILLLNYSNAQTWTWDTLVNSDEGIRLVKDHADNVFTYSAGQNRFNKYTFTGALLWNKVLPANAFIQGIDSDGNNSVYITGTFDGALTIESHTVLSEGLNDIFIVKYNEDGLFGWLRQISSKGDDYVADISCDKAGDILITGRIADTVNFSGTIIYKEEKRNLFIARYDSYGNFESSFLSTLLTSWYDDYASGGEIEIDSNNNIILLASINGTVQVDTAIFTDHFSAYFLKMDPNFHLIWSYKTENEYTVYVKDLKINAADELIYLVLHSWHYVNSGQLKKRTPDGLTVSTLYYIPQGYITGFDFDSSGNIYFSGWERHWTHSGNPPDKYFALFGGIDPFGSLAWLKSDSALSVRYGAGIAAGSHLIVTGGFQDSMSIFHNYIDTSSAFLATLDLSQVGIPEVSDAMDIAVFPNPSTGIFNISFPEKFKNGNICVYDILGNCILTKPFLESKEQFLDLTGNAKGIYFVEVQAGEKRVNKKIILN